MLNTMLALLVLVQGGSSPAVTGGQGHRFTYVLPEGFRGWACADFGVRGAAPLPVRDDGSYQVDVQPGILTTSSLPHLNTFPANVRILQFADGKLQPDSPSLEHSSTRHQTDTTSAVSRHCLFFGSVEESRAARRPPTIYESTLENIDDLVASFEFVSGALADFINASPICVEARDSDRRLIVNAMSAALEKDPGSLTKCSDSFRGTRLRYETRRGIYTHSSARGELFGFGEVRRRGAKGTDALVVWVDDTPGSATELATRFGRDVADLIAKAAGAGGSFRYDVRPTQLENPVAARALPPATGRTRLWRSAHQLFRISELDII